MVTQLADGRHLFRVFLPHAAKVEVVGSFTGWRAKPVALERQNPGWWTGTLEVPVGAHEFCYLVDHSIWLADYAAQGVKLASSGQWVSQITAKESGMTPVRAGAPERVAV